AARRRPATGRRRGGKGTEVSGTPFAAGERLPGGSRGGTSRRARANVLSLYGRRGSRSPSPVLRLGLHCLAGNGLPCTSRKCVGRGVGRKCNQSTGGPPNGRAVYYPIPPSQTRKHRGEEKGRVRAERRRA